MIGVLSNAGSWAAWSGGAFGVPETAQLAVGVNPTFPGSGDRFQYAIYAQEPPIAATAPSWSQMSHAIETPDAGAPTGDLGGASATVAFMTAAVLTTSISLAASATVAFTTAAVLTTQISLVATATVAFSTNAVLTTSISLAANATIAFTTTADLSAAVAPPQPAPFVGFLAPPHRKRRRWRDVVAEYLAALFSPLRRAARQAGIARRTAIDSAFAASEQDLAGPAILPSPPPAAPLPEVPDLTDLPHFEEDETPPDLDRLDAIIARIGPAPIHPPSVDLDALFPPALWPTPTRPIEATPAPDLDEILAELHRTVPRAPPESDRPYPSPLRRSRVIISRQTLAREVAVRERRLLHWVERGLQAHRQVLAAPELRTAAAYGHPPADLVQRLDQVWALLAPAMSAALAAPVTRAAAPLTRAAPEADARLAQTAQDLADRQIASLIREIGPRQLAAVRAQLAAIMEFGPSEATLAAIGRATGLTTQQTQAVAHFLTRQLDGGYSVTTALRTAEQYADNLLAQRARTIARQEAVTYTNQLVLQRGRDLGGVVVKQWVSARDGNVDLGQPQGVCRQLDNGQVIPLSDAFRTADGLTFDAPPAHIGCRCVLEIQREE